MTQTEQRCSTLDQLLIFLRGDLSPREESELQLHLNDCVTCRERLESTAADPSQWNEVKQFFGSNTLRTSSLGLDIENEEANHGTQRIRHVLDDLLPTDDPESLGRIGGYEVTGVVGAGGMGVVLKAHDRSLDRIVAIKVMAPHLASSGSARKRFAREAKAAAAVLHPNVIAIHSVASDDANPYLVMPYVRGASLQKRIDSQGPLPLKDTLRIGAQIAAGLAAAHEQGLVHRDIKPANILLEEGVERVTITDFGLARAVDDASMTCSGVIAGTPQYMSPEQTRGEPIDARSDLFSLGSVLYAMCAGRSPFRAETTYGVLHRIANDNPTPVCEVNSDIPTWLGHIIERLMAKRPEDRFESAAQVAELLEGCLAHVQQPAAMALPAPVAELIKSFGPHRSTTTESLDGFRYPPIGKFIAAAAFAFSLIFAGVLVVLELNKGTLTIECDADNVPIRIMQGDNVVERMTVCKSPQNVRIAAGNYVVEVDGDFQGITIKDGKVSLARHGTATVEISKNAKLFLASNFRPGNIDGLRFGERHERIDPIDRGYATYEVAEPGEMKEIFASFPTLGNGIEEVGLIVSVEPPHGPTEPSIWHNFLVRASGIRRLTTYSACEVSVEGKEFFKPDDTPYTVGYLQLQLDGEEKENATVDMIAGSAHVNINYVVGLPNEQIRKILKLDAPSKRFESWLPVNLQTRPQSAWASHLMKLDGWEYDRTRGVPNMIQQEVTLKSGETRTVSIERADGPDTSLTTARAPLGLKPQDEATATVDPKAADDERAENSVKRVMQYLSAVQENDTETIKSIAKGINNSDDRTKKMSKLLDEQGIPKLHGAWFENHLASVALGPVSSSDEKMNGRFLLFTLSLVDERWSIVDIDLKARDSLPERLNNVSQRTSDPDTINNSLQGVWEFVSVETDGVVTEYQTIQTQPSMAPMTFTLKITGEIWMVNAGHGSNGSDLGSDSHRVKIDGNKLTFFGTRNSIPGLGYNNEVPTVGHGLFKHDGDSLIYLMSPAAVGGELNGQSEHPIKFPESFETKGTQNNVFRLRRVGTGESDARDTNSQNHVPTSKSSPEFPPVKILVRDEDGNPLKGVRVSLFQGAAKEGGKNIEINATSNENGLAVDRILPFGNYSLTLMTSEGWQLSGSRVNVEFETGLSTTIVAPSPNKRAKLVVELNGELNDKLHSRPSLNELRFGELQEHRIGNPGYSTDLLPEPGEDLGGYEFFPTIVNGIEEVAIGVRFEIRRTIKQPAFEAKGIGSEWRWYSPDDSQASGVFVVTGNKLRWNLDHASWDGKSINRRPNESSPFFKLKSFEHQVGGIVLRLADPQPLPYAIDVPAGDTVIFVTSVYGKPTDEVRKSLGWVDEDRSGELWLRAPIQFNSKWLSSIVAPGTWTPRNYGDGYNTLVGHLLRQQRSIKQGETIQLDFSATKSEPTNPTHDADAPLPEVLDGTMQVFFSQPHNAKASLTKGSDRELVLPLRVNLPFGETHYFELSDLPDYSGIQLSGSIELKNVSKEAESYLKHNAVPIEINKDDIERCLKNDVVIKAIYVPNPTNLGTVFEAPRVLDSPLKTEGELCEEAERLGATMAVLRIYKKR